MPRSYKWIGYGLDRMGWKSLCGVILRAPLCGAKGSPKNISFDKLGILSQPGGRGGLTESQIFCKIVKTKLTFVNGQKCDETHNT